MAVASVRDRASAITQRITSLRPRTYLIASWLLFALGSYPGYMSVDSALQLYMVRSGDYSDYAPGMTAIWGLLEYIVAGPFPMLALQSGLFLFGLFAILRTLLVPRVAAVTAGVVLLFPPVFTVLAVIWPESLMTAALVASVGAYLQRSPRWTAVAALLMVVACTCRPEVALALLPLTLLVVRPTTWWRRVGVAILLTVAIAASARIGNWALTVVDTGVWEHRLQMMDVIGTLRRARVTDEASLRDALAGLPIADPDTFRDRITARRDALDWWPLAHGNEPIFEPLTTEEHRAAMNAAWRRVITTYPRAYLTHRWTMTRAMLGVRKNWQPIYDSFGKASLTAPVYHRAKSSAVQTGIQRFVRAFKDTPLFRPWFYLPLVVLAIALARKQPLLCNLAISGLVFEFVMFLFAPTPDYRFSHWLVTTTCIVLASVCVMRRPTWRVQTDEPR